MTQSKLRKSTFGRAVGKLITASALSQLISFISALFLVRFFSPAEFGEFATVLAVSAVLSIIASGRYEFAIMNPEDNAEALRIATLAILLSVFFCIILLSVMAVVYWSLDGTGIALPFYFVLIIPAFTLVQSHYQILVKWGNRNKNYRGIGTAAIVLAFSVGTLQIVFGEMGGAAVSLCLAYLIGMILAIIVLVSSSRGELWLHINYLKGNHFKRILKQYRDFPILSMPQSIISKGSAELPIILAASLFSVESAGLLALTRRVLNKPINLVATNVGLVYHQQLAEKSKGSPSSLYHYSKKLALLMFAFMLSVALPIFFIGESLFALVFGEDWAESGVFAVVLLPLMISRSVATTLSSVFPFFRRQLLALVVHVFFLAAICISFLVGVMLESFYWSLSLYSIGAFITYCGITTLALLIVRRNTRTEVIA